MARDYEYTDSRACYGEIVDNVFDRMVESRREVWFADDGSGLIRSRHIRSLFFTDQQRLRWENMPNRSAREASEPSLDLFAAGCFHGPRSELSRLTAGRAELEEHLRSRRQLTVKGIRHLIGEAHVPHELRHVFFDLAADLPDACILAEAADQLGRVGIGIARIQRNHREELVFNRKTRELLGYRQVVVDPDSQYEAPAGAVTGWTSYVRRQLVDALPAGTPAVPGPPCDPPGAGRVTVVRPGLLLGTGYFTDLRPQLDQWLDAGVITETDHQSMQPPG